MLLRLEKNILKSIKKRFSGDRESYLSIAHFMMILTGIHSDREDFGNRQTDGITETIVR